MLLATHEGVLVFGGVSSGYKPQNKYLGILVRRLCAAYIVPWLADKTVFQLWGGERFGSYPLTIDKMNRKYQNDNGDCAEEDNFYPFTAFDGETVAVRV